MRLIDADALNLDREVELADDWKTAHELANCVKYAPTVDAVPVVRCKECRYWRQEVSPTEHWVCAHHSFNERKMYTTPDFYCADGERREKDGD